MKILHSKLRNFNKNKHIVLTTETIEVRLEDQNEIKE